MLVSEAKHLRYFVCVDLKDDCDIGAPPFAVRLEEVPEFIKNWLGSRMAHQGYISNARKEQLQPSDVTFRLEPVECGEDGEPWDWTHCAVCDALLESHGDCSNKECKSHTEEYTGEPQGSPSLRDDGRNSDGSGESYAERNQ